MVAVATGPAGPTIIYASIIVQYGPGNRFEQSNTFIPFNGCIDVTSLLK
ncbi:MAG: hypothetical protein SVR08_03920 [Spirochaetota bacterium]|nr:hypothetical protein [Spirochaetota bacterium]